MPTATFLEYVDWANHTGSRLFRLEPPPASPNGTVAEFVLVCEASFITGLETFIYACDRDGAVLDWEEMEGSIRGKMDYEAALNEAGYEIAAALEVGDGN